MERIDITKYNLPVTEREHELPKLDWLYEAIKLLINQRVAHCRSQLEETIKKGEAYIEYKYSPIVFYKNAKGEEYGHFSEPVYNDMIEFLNHIDHIEYHLNKMIVQQALRQYFYNSHNYSSLNNDMLLILEKYNKTYEDLEGALTEMMLVM